MAPQMLGLHKRLTVLSILILNDFHLHLDSYLNIWQNDPTFSPFDWVYSQGYYFCNAFWSAYWSLALLLVTSLLLVPPKHREPVT